MKNKVESKVTEEKTEKVIVKKAIKPKPVIKTERVRLLVKSSVIKMKSENGYVNIPEKHVDILQRHGIVKRVK